MIGESVTLNHVEGLLALYAAKQRQENSRASGFVNGKRGPQDDLKTDLEGMAAEIAFCKLFNLFPDLSAMPPNYGEPDYDCILHGFTVDVKSTTHTSGRLAVITWKAARCPAFYALMTGTCPTYVFRGFMPSCELLRRERLGNLGAGPNSAYIANQSELMEWEDALRTTNQPA